MSGSEVVIDARGELCPTPSLKVEQFLETNGVRSPFSVLVDHPASVESLRLIATLYGWRLEAEEGKGEWRVRFLPPEPPA